MLTATGILGGRCGVGRRTRRCEHAKRPVKSQESRPAAARALRVATPHDICYVAARMLQGPTAVSGSGGFPRAFGSVVLLQAPVPRPADRGVPGASCRGRGPAVRRDVPGRVAGLERARRRGFARAGDLAGGPGARQPRPDLRRRAIRASSCSSSASTSRAPTWARCSARAGALSVGMAAHTALEIGEALAFVRAPGGSRHRRADRRSPGCRPRR